MDREKLYQAARSEAFDLVDCAHQTDSHDLVESFVQGAKWFMQQPLSERLTDEEKEKLTPANRYILGTIFGSGLFK